MNRHCNQPVGLKDLEGYLKRFDYLGGFSDDEKAQIRKNIGAISPEEVNPPTKYQDATYNELAYLVDKKKLVIGNKYALTDFQSIYESNVEVGGIKQTWGTDDSQNPSPKCTLILSAIAEDKFDPRVLMLRDDYENSHKWVVEYEFDSEILADGKKTKGKITFMRDTNHNSAFYNFKDYKMRRYKKELETLGVTLKNQLYVDLHTFNNNVNFEFVESSENQDIHDNFIGHNSFNNVFLEETSDNIFDGEMQDNTFAGDCKNNHLYFGFQRNKFSEDVIFTAGMMKDKTVTSDYHMFNLPCSKIIVREFEAKYWLQYFDEPTLTYQFALIP